MSAIALTHGVPAFAGTTWRCASPHSPGFFLRWPSVRRPQGVELDEAGEVAMIVGNRPLNARAYQLLSLSSLKMGEPSPLDSKPVSE